MKVYLLSYATNDFIKWQRELNDSGLHYGIENIISHTRAELIKTDFYKNNLEILDLPRGGGYWLWKPYYILETLQLLQNGDILVYADSGCKFISSPDPLIEICKQNQSGIVAFDTFPLKNSQLTKRDAFINMNCDEEQYWSAKHVIATTMLFRKNDFVINFVKEWLYYSLNFNSITDIPNINGKSNFPDFYKHQGDQPIFSILIKKYDLETYRNPSKHGNFLKLKEFRKKGEMVCYPYFIINKLIPYSDQPYQNSPYETIFEFNRARVTPKRTIWDKIKRQILGIS